MRMLERELPRSSDFAVELAAEAAAFDLHHAACEVRCWTPTGRAASDLPWLEPFALRRVEGRGRRGQSERRKAAGRGAEGEGVSVWSRGGAAERGRRCGWNSSVGKCVGMKGSAARKRGL